MTAAASLAVTVSLNFLLVPRLGVLGLAVAGSIGAWCNVGLLLAVLARKKYFRLPVRIAGRILRIAVAAALMGVVLWLLMEPLDSWFAGNVFQRALAIGAIVVAGLASFGFVAAVLGVLDKGTVQRLMRRQT